MANVSDSARSSLDQDEAVEPTFLVSLVGTVLWLGGLWFMSRSLRTGMSLHLASMGLFAVLNVMVGAYPGLVGAVFGVVIMVRTIRRETARRRRQQPARRTSPELERVWSEALERVPTQPARWPGGELVHGGVAD
jgi:hypothetical protein